MPAKRVSPSILHPLKEALTHAFWYKKDLRPFLATTLDDHTLVANLNWSEYKRNIVAQLVDSMAANQSTYFDQLVNLAISAAEISDPHWLKQVEGGEEKYRAAVVALSSLRDLVAPLKSQREESADADRRRREEEARSELRGAISSKLEELRELMLSIIKQDPQQRGYSLETLLNQLFALFDIEAKGPFRVVGEQIDGSFTFESTDYLLEAKWTSSKSTVAELDSLAGKVGRRLDNTLGLFVSMNGYEESAVSTYSRQGPCLFLVDGADLNAVLDDRIDLPRLLRRKRQHAARTGEVMLGVGEIL